MEDNTMRAECQPLTHFQYVYELAKKTENEERNSLPIKNDDIGVCKPPEKRIKEYDKIESIQLPDIKISGSQDLNNILDKLNEFSKNEDPAGMLEFLNFYSTYLTIENLSQDEKLYLTKSFFKNANNVTYRTAILSEFSQYLIAQPTSDQYLVGLMGSLLDFKFNKDLSAHSDNPECFLYLLSLFRKNNASHFPEKISNYLGKKNMNSEEWSCYGFQFPDHKATKNISKSCEICLIQQTNPEEHNKIFHPAGLEILDINHPSAKSLYSKDFLELMETGQCADKKGRLLPPVLFRIFGKEGVNFSALNASALICPEIFLREELYRYIDSRRDRVIEGFRNSVTREIPDHERQQVVDCFKAMANFSTNIPVLAKIGAEIKALLDEKKISIPDDSVPDRYVVNKFASNRPWKEVHDNERDISESLFGLNIAQRRKNHRYLAGKKPGDMNYFFTREATRGILQKAMNKVSKDGGSNVQPGSAPVFIGFIPKPIANRIARQHGFLDSNWSGNFLHGKYSHALALACLADLAGLNQEVLETMVDNDLWVKVLDLNSYAPIDIDTDISELPSLLVLNLYNVLRSVPHSPFNYHSLLTTGELSASLNDIKTLILLSPPEKQAGLLAQFAARIAMKDELTMNDLTKMTEHIRVLEMVLSTKHLNSMEKVIEETGTKTPSENELYDPAARTYLNGYVLTIGNFPLESGRAQKIKAKKYFDKSYRIQGIKEDRRKDPEVLDITRKQDIEQCNAFIAYPPGSAPVAE